MFSSAARLVVEVALGAVIYFSRDRLVISCLESALAILGMLVGVPGWQGADSTLAILGMLDEVQELAKEPTQHDLHERTLNIKRRAKHSCKFALPGRCWSGVRGRT